MLAVYAAHAEFHVPLAAVVDELGTGPFLEIVSENPATLGL